MAKRVFKSKMKLGGNYSYRKFDDYEVGDVVVGEVTGLHIDQYGKECLVIKVESAEFADKKAGKALIGKDLVINAAGTVNNQLDKWCELEGSELSDLIGKGIQLIYTGMAEVTKGKFKGTDCHTVEIEIGDFGDESSEIESEENIDEDAGDYDSEGLEDEDSSDSADDEEEEF